MSLLAVRCVGNFQVVEIASGSRETIVWASSWAGQSRAHNHSCTHEQNKHKHPRQTEICNTGRLPNTCGYRLGFEGKLPSHTTAAVVLGATSSFLQALQKVSPRTYTRTILYANPLHESRMCEDLGLERHHHAGYIPKETRIYLSFGTFARQIIYYYLFRDTPSRRPSRAILVVWL